MILPPAYVQNIPFKNNEKNTGQRLALDVITTVENYLIVNIYLTESYQKTTT